MTSLIDELGANHTELSDMLSSLLDDKHNLSIAIKQAQESSSAAVGSLQEKVYTLIFLFY
jgi:hypothetical protein